MGKGSFREAASFSLQYWEKGDERGEMGEGRWEK